MGQRRRKIKTKKGNKQQEQNKSLKEAADLLVLPNQLRACRTAQGSAEKRLTGAAKYKRGASVPRMRTCHGWRRPLCLKEKAKTPRSKSRDRNSEKPQVNKSWASGEKEQDQSEKMKEKKC